MPGAKHKTFILWLSALFLLAPGEAGAQYTIQHFDSKVLPGSDKLYWASHTSGDQYYLAGKRGLVHFDGQTATSITVGQTGNNHTFDQNQQSPPVEDRQGNVWVSTPEGIHRYTPRTRLFRTYQFQRNGQPVTTGYKIFHYSSDDDALWIATDSALWVLTPQTGSYRMISDENSSKFLALSPQQQFIAGVPWGKELSIYELTEGQTVATARRLRLPEAAYSVSFGVADSVVYVGTKAGLGQVRITTDSLLFELIQPAGPVTDLVFDAKKNCLWLNLKRHGVACYNLSSGQLTASYDVNNGLSGVENNFLSQDAAGRIWISITDKGFDVLHPGGETFTNPGPALTGPGSDMTINANGQPLIISRSGVLYTGHPNQDGYFWTADSANYPGGANRLIDARFVRNKDRLIVTSNFSIAEARPGEQTWEVYRKTQTNINGVFLAPDGSLLSLTPQGVKGITLQKDTVVTYPVSGFEQLPSAACVKLFQLGDSTFVLSYQDQEIWQCRFTGPGTYQVTARIPLAGDLNGVVETPDGRRFAGVATGLFELGDTLAIPLLTSLRGQGVLSVETLISDETGTLWLGTKNGLFSYQPHDQSVLYFGEADGLADERFRDISPVRLNDGSIWMMTTKEVIGFDPEHLRQQFVPSEPYLSGIWVNNLPFQDSIQPAYLKYLKQPYQNNTLNFTFSASGLTASPLTAIQYQLTDYDLAPLLASPGQDIRYPKLPPGDYVLEYAAVNRNGLIAGNKSLLISIGKPFYQTLLFYLLCTCALALIIASFYIAGLRRERLKQQRLHEQQARLAAERDRIAGEVHDDLGGQISSILYLSEEMLLTGTTPDNECELHRIHELSRNSLQNVRDIIFALDNRRVTLADLGEQLRGAGEVFFGDRKIEFRCTDAFTRPAFELTSRQKRNLTLIVKEAWHNIAKHARATEVNVDLQEEDDVLSITITDNGVGFTVPRSANGMGGFGLENMQEKATAIGGNLAIDSAPGRGTRLTLNWPINN